MGASRYGLPYMGSKGRFADQIVEALPAGRRFVDLFGGGGAVSHAAVLSGKYDSVLYCDIDPVIADAVRLAAEGYYNASFIPSFISHEDFNRLYLTDGYVRMVWSFGGGGQRYLYSREVEFKKSVLHDWIVNGRWNPLIQEWTGLKPDFLDRETDYQKRRLTYEREIARIFNAEPEKKQDLSQIQHLEHLTRLARFEKMGRAGGFDVQCMDYRDYEYQPGDVVYCDIPYEGSLAGARGPYTRGFDNTAFYMWVITRPYPVYFSSYYLPFFSDKIIWSHQTRCAFSSRRNDIPTTEHLYMI